VSELEVLNICFTRTVTFFSGKLAYCGVLGVFLT
jgi:hypothetical protein